MSDFKRCPFCASKEVSIIENHVVCECGASAYATDWNKRPLEDRLKKAIDIMLRAIEFAQEMTYTKNVIKERLKNARKESVKILTQHFGEKK